MMLVQQKKAFTQRDPIGGQANEWGLFVGGGASLITRACKMSRSLPLS
jgi:hypothetical protein